MLWNLFKSDSLTAKGSKDIARRKGKVLFSTPSGATFYLKDELIFRKHYEVKTIDYSWNNKRSILIFPVKAFFGTLRCDLTFSWFGSFHAFFTVIFSRLLGKKSIVVAGGHDVSNMPEINYGLLNTKLWKYFAIYSFRLCDKILAVSEYTKKELLRNIDGISKEKVEVLYHGFDPKKFYPEGEEEDLVISVGTVDKEIMVRKGLEDFVKTSVLLPEYRFVLIGEYEAACFDYLKGLSDNIELTGFVNHEVLLSYMQRAKVYVQISAHEGFGCSLAEAMLCECIPVVTNCGAIPEVVGDTGYYVEYGDVKGTAEAIKKALKDKDNREKKARERIKKKFTLEERERRLIKTI